MDASESTAILADGTVRYVRQTDWAPPELLILVLNKDAKSWSSDFRSSQRTAYDFTDLLVTTNLDFSTVSLAMLTSETGEFDSMIQASSRLPFARTTIYLRNSTEESFQYEGRHDPNVQLARRAALAKLRNRLMISALQDEQHLLWLDADVVELSESIVQALLWNAKFKDDAGIITAPCHQNQMDNYDKNAWKVNSPQLLGPVADDDREAAVRELIDTRLMVPELIKDTQGLDAVPLDSVGGTILYMRADLVRQGLTFPYYNVVGATWSQKGWIGVETEGLCYLARELQGGSCYVLGGPYYARHTDWG